MKFMSGNSLAARPTSAQRPYSSGKPENSRPLWMQMLWMPSARACSMNGMPTSGLSSSQPTPCGPHCV